MAKHVLSIEIGTQVTKIVEIDYKKKNPHVYRAVSFATPEGVIEDGVIRDKERTCRSRYEREECSVLDCFQ